jgi:hypothetical protein
MSKGSWVDNDGLVRQYGTQKAVAETGGSYNFDGPNRVDEFVIDLSTLSTSHATIVSLTSKFPSMANYYIEKVEVIAEVGMSTASSPTLSVGVCNDNLLGGSATVYMPDGSTIATATVPSNGATAFVSAAAASTLSSAGDLLTLTKSSTAAGNYVGDYEDTTNLTSPMYVTATLGTATATGIIRMRVWYHGVGTISQ